MKDDCINMSKYSVTIFSTILLRDEVIAKFVTLYLLYWYFP